MKKVLYLLVIFLFTVLGYATHLHPQQIALEKTVLWDLQNDLHKKPKNSIIYAISVASDEIRRANGIQNKNPSTVDVALEKSDRTPHENDLFQAMGNDTVGMQVRHYLIARNHADELPGVQLLVQHTLEDAQQDPQANLETLKTTLDRIPASIFPLERASILSLMDTSSPQSSAVKELALAELTQNPVPARPEPSSASTPEELNQALSTSPDLLLPISAHLVFLNATSDATEALQGTLQAITAQPDAGIRLTLTSQFLEKYPAMQNQLHTALQTQGVHLPNNKIPPLDGGP